ncbi:hypothetical protein LOAG_06615, partial [Loa loa]
ILENVQIAVMRMIWDISNDNDNNDNFCHAKLMIISGDNNLIIIFAMRKMKPLYAAYIDIPMKRKQSGMTTVKLFLLTYSPVKRTFNRISIYQDNGRSFMKQTGIDPYYTTKYRN